MHAYKVVFVGDSGVGKTSLIKAFIGQNPTDVRSTISADIYTFRKEDILVVVWDLAGQEWYRDIIANFLRGAILAVMVFDLSRPATLYSLIRNWMNLVIEFAGPHTLIVVVGNKKDIKKIDDQIIAAVLDKLKEKLRVNFYIQTSAIRNENVSKVFDVIFELVKSIHCILAARRG